MITPVIAGWETDGSDSSPQPPAPMPPLPVNIQTLVNAAANAARSIERFVQLHDPTGRDLRALQALNDALLLFGVKHNDAQL